MAPLRTALPRAYRHLIGAWVVFGLAGCGQPGGLPWQPGPVEYDDDDAADHHVCDGDPGAQEVRLCADDESHTPVQDGASYGIARRYQGSITFIAPIWFGGLEGGRQLDELAFFFVDDAGEVLGTRSTVGYVLPCEADGSVAAHSLEIFFAPNVEVETYFGVTGTLTVEADLGLGHMLSDSVEAVLVEDE